MNIAAIWMGLPQWARDAIKVAGIVLGVVFLGRQYVKGKEDDAVQKDRQASAVKQAQAREAVTTRSAEIITHEREHSDAAIQARDDSTPAPSFDELPDEVQRVLSRSARGDQTS